MKVWQSAFSEAPFFLERKGMNYEVSLGTSLILDKSDFLSARIPLLSLSLAFLIFKASQPISSAMKLALYSHSDDNKLLFLQPHNFLCCSL